MKKIITLAAAAAMTVSAFAQNDYIHVFRSDKAINSFKGSEILSITHEDGSAATGFNTLVVNGTDGTTTKISLSAIDSVQVRSKDIPKVYVTLTDAQYSNLTELITSLGKSYVYQSTVRIDGNGMFDDVPEQHAEFRGRGNSTWNMAKKPYRFKLDKKLGVCGMKKAKSFALIANFIDNSLMRNPTALWVANYLEIPYSNHCVPCEVYLNGNFKGAYMMTEKIGISGGSVDIDEYKGILFELDSNYDEDFKFRYTFNRNKQLPVMVKDPDFTEICDSLGVTTSEYLSKWQADFTTMADAVVNTPTTGSLSQYIDIELAAKFFLVNSIANNHEMKHPKSLYIYKDSIGGVYKFGPNWDFDWAFMFENYNDETASATVPLVSNDGDYAGASFLKYLFANEEFRTIYKNLWDDFVANGYPQLIAYLDEYCELIEPSAKHNGLTWASELSSLGVTNCYDLKTNYKALKTWLDQRISYCNSSANYGLY